MSYYKITEYDNLLQFGVVFIFILIFLYSILKRKGTTSPKSLQLLNKEQEKLDNEYRNIQPDNPKYKEYLNKYKELNGEYERALPFKYWHIILFFILMVICIFSDKITEYDSKIPTIIFLIIIMIFTINGIKKGEIKISGLITSLLLIGTIFFGTIYALFYISKLFGEESLIYTFPAFTFLIVGIGYYIYKEKEAANGTKDFFENRNK